VVERFYVLFDSIYRYLQDFLKFLKDLEEGYFIQHTVDGVLDDDVGKQLMCEALYLLGVMYILLDLRIPGPVREKMIVTHLRRVGENQVENYEDVAKLCQSTGFDPLSPDPQTNQPVRPQYYPAKYFNRFKIDEDIVLKIVAVLQNDDIYHRKKCFPAPDQKSIRLASQASMIYVCLYFCPQRLHKEETPMREIVDKFFSDNYILTLYMGVIVDLSKDWGHFKAAATALKNTVSGNGVLKNGVKMMNQVV
jgi:WASH complex subunit strumpellin